MTIPKMILFDCAHTLEAEQGHDSLRGIVAVMRHAVKNPQNISAEQVASLSAELYYGICGQVRGIGAELHNLHALRLIYEYLQIDFDVPLTEIERIYWDNADPGAATPYAGEMLTFLHERAIRTGVISNMGFSGDALAPRLNRLLPENHFEFIIASSDYMIRKPNPMLFELALRKAGLQASEVWFCGDSPSADIVGASFVGIFPVWYDDLTMENPFQGKNSNPPVCKHLHIHDWLALIRYWKA